MFSFDFFRNVHVFRKKGKEEKQIKPLQKKRKKEKKWFGRFPTPGALRAGERIKESKQIL